MDAKIIQELLHDPEFDPGKWALDAVTNYLKAYPHEVLSDPIGRKYLFKGLDVSDISAISMRIVDQETMREFARAFIKRLPHIINQYNWDSALNTVIQKIHGLIPKEEAKSLLRDLVKSEGVKGYNIRYEYLDIQDREIALAAMDYWNEFALSTGDWIRWLRSINTEDVVERLSTIVDRVSDSPYLHSFENVLRVYGTILEILPTEQLKTYYNLIIGKIYRRYVTSNSSHHLTLNTCQCGYNPKTAGSATLHRNRSRKPICKTPNILKQIRLRMAKEIPGSLICPECGIKEYDNPLNLTMHRKYCGGKAKKESTD